MNVLKTKIAGFGLITLKLLLNTSIVLSITCNYKNIDFLKCNQLLSITFSNVIKYILFTFNILKYTFIKDIETHKTFLLQCF